MANQAILASGEMTSYNYVGRTHTYCWLVVYNPSAAYITLNVKNMTNTDDLDA